MTTDKTREALLIQQVKEYGEMCDKVGRSRSSNCYAHDTRAVVAACNRMAAIEASIRALSAQAAPVQAVAWQARMMLGNNWGDWHPCSQETFDKLSRSLDPGYEARALGVIATPSAAPQQTGEMGEADEREAFERAEAASNLQRDEEGDYENPCVQSAWEGWQARAALSRPIPDAAVAEGPTDSQMLDWLERAGDITLGRVSDAPHDSEMCIVTDESAYYGKTLRAAIKLATYNATKEQGR